MQKVLVTTLGKASKDAGGRYRKMSYRFPDGYLTQPTPFFMLALLEYQKQQKRLPDNILILGTASSMWDALFEQGSLADDVLFAQLLRELEHENVSAPTLDALSQTLSREFGADITCALIPSGANQQEQADILRIIATHIPEKCAVCFDVTHGYRILPMLQLLAVFYLQELRDATVTDIFYGAAEMGDRTAVPPVAPVIRLDFIRNMMQWLTTLPLAEQTGRYDKIAAMFTDTQPKLGEALTSHSLHLRTNQTPLARQSAEQIDSLLQTPFADPEAELYRPALLRKFSWRKGADLAAWQILSAKAALKAGDLLRATILLREAHISLALPPEQQSSPNARKRKDAELQLDTDFTFETLTVLRNCMAHASKPRDSKLTKHVRELLADEKKLLRELTRIAELYYNTQRPEPPAP